MIPAMGITRWLSLFLDMDVSVGCLRALARCGYGCSCPFPHDEGVAINGHSPSACQKRAEEGQRAQARERINEHCAP